MLEAEFEKLVEADLRGADLTAEVYDKLMANSKDWYDLLHVKLLDIDKQFTTQKARAVCPETTRIWRKWKPGALSYKHKILARMKEARESGNVPKPLSEGNVLQQKILTELQAILNELQHQSMLMQQLSNK